MTDPRLLEAVGGFVLQRPQTARPAIIGLSGSQGSGKSTLAAALAAAHGGVTLSLDDVYRTRSERERLARDIHPLLRTRGVPLTHDLELLDATLALLTEADDASSTPLPVFDKLADDRAPQPRIWRGRPRFILLEGWCLGALPQPPLALAEALNGLERDGDADGRWRRAVNAAVGGTYAALRAGLDGMVYLQAPDFGTVFEWRCQQQAGLLGERALDPQARSQIADFIAYFERLTRWMMAGGVDADLTIELDNMRRVVACRGNRTTSGRGEQ